MNKVEAAFIPETDLGMVRLELTPRMAVARSEPLLRIDSSCRPEDSNLDLRLFRPVLFLLS